MISRIPTSLLMLCLLQVGLCFKGYAEQPNIVIIMADDMGYSDIGCFGGEVKTPHIDALAEDGLRFTQFYNTGRCCPTRAAMLTGLYPHQAGVGHMVGQGKLLFFEHEGNRAIRDGKWKLVKLRKGSWELYDLDADRSELNDLAAKDPQRVEQMTAQWSAWAKRANVTPGPFDEK